MALHTHSCLCIHTRAFAYTFVLLHTHSCLCIHTHAFADTLVPLHTHMPLHTHSCLCLHTRAFAYTLVPLHTHSCLCLHTRSFANKRSLQVSATDAQQSPLQQDIIHFSHWGACQPNTFLTCTTFLYVLCSHWEYQATHWSWEHLLNATVEEYGYLVRFIID